MADVSTSTSTNWLQPQWQQYLTGLQNVLPQNGAPMPVYGGPTVAPQNQYQTTAGDMMNQLATNGTPAGTAANSAIVNQAGGVANPYMGNGAEFQGLLSGVNQNMADAYQRGTAAQTDAAMARQGAYGGSGYNELTAANNKAFGQAVGNTDANLYYQNYQNSGNLFNQDQNRQLQAAGLGLQSQGVDQNAIGGLNSIGTQQQGNTQNVLDAMNNYFSNSQQANLIPSDIMGNALSRASGASTTTTQSVPGSSDWMNAIGGILAGFGLLS